MKNKGYFSKRGTDSEKKISKKIAIITVVVLAIFIPSIIALINYSIKSNETPPAVNTSMSVSLYYKDELLYNEKANLPATDSSLVSIFSEILNNITQTDKLPENLDTSRPFKAVISKNDVTAEYICYFSSKEASSYLVDKNNKVYKLPAASSESFMASVYAELLYESSTLPKLYTNSGDLIVPTSVDWKYKNIFGVELTATKIKTEPAEIEYNMAGALGLSFEKEPSSCTIDIKKSGIPWNTDITYHNLSLQTVETGTTLQFSVKASWDKTEENESFGTATYNFKVIIRDRAEFNINKTSVSTGDFIIISCTNIFDIDKIRFSAEPHIDYSPVFFQNGDTVYSLIPFSEKLTAGTYALTFSYGASMQTMSVEVQTPPKTPYRYIVQNKNSNIFKVLTSDSVTQAFDNILNGLNQTIPEYIFFDQPFMDYTQNGISVIHSYGTEFKTDTDTKYYSLKGIQYSLSNGASVLALNNGIVSYSGNCEYLGNFIVVEHGLGLRTVYAHLSSLNVSTGDAVIKGQSIGRSGRICDDAEEGVLIMCYVFDTPIDYSNLYGMYLDTQEQKN